MVHEYALTHGTVPPPESMMKELYEESEMQSQEMRQLISKKIRRAFSQIKKRLAEDIEP